MADDSAPNQDGSNDGNNTGGTSAGDGGKAADDSFKPITSQDDLNRVVADRISRERAKFADYDDLKAKAAKLDEIDEQNKSEIQKATEAQQKAEAERDKARAEALRFKVATKHGISDEDAELFLTGSDEETLTKQAKRLSDRKAGDGMPRAPHGSSRNNEPAGDLREFTRNVFSPSG